MGILLLAAAVLELDQHHFAGPNAIAIQLTPTPPHAANDPNFRPRHIVVPKNAAQEAAQTEAQMAAMIRAMQLGYSHSKILTKVRCTPSPTWPKAFGGDPGDAFNCLATFATSTQRWCTLFDPATAERITDYQGPRMCEGPPNPMIEP